MGWRNRPTFKTNWPKNITHIIFIDENGDSSLSGVKKDLRHGIITDDSNRYFTVTGCVIKKEDFCEVRDTMTDIKYKHWDNGEFNYSGEKKRVCFHSNEIRRSKGPFNSAIINRELFFEDLNSYMEDTKIKIISSTIDKYKHCNKYIHPKNPYELCMAFIMERIAKFELKENENCIFILESRGKREDKNLLDCLKQILDSGTEWVSKSDLKNIKGIYFNPKWDKSDDCKRSYIGLELADLVSYPIYKYCKNDIKDEALSLIHI